MLNKNERIGLFLLRIGAGLLIFLWGIDKIVAPESTVKIYSHFYFMTLSAPIAPLIGILEALLGLAIIFGFFKTWSYGLGLLLHTISHLSTWKILLWPFGEGHLFIAGWTVWGTFFALYLLRNRDTLWTLDGLLERK